MTASDPRYAFRNVVIPLSEIIAKLAEDGLAVVDRNDVPQGVMPRTEEQPSGPTQPHRVDAVAAVTDLSMAMGKVEGALSGLLQIQKMPASTRLGIERTLADWRNNQHVIWSAIHVAMAHEEEFRARIAQWPAPGDYRPGFVDT